MSVDVSKIKKYSEVKAEILNIFSQFKVEPKGWIFIKPNLSARPPVIRGENTSVEFMKGLIEALLEFPAVTRIQIGHSSLLGTADKVFPFEKVVKGGGFDVLPKLYKKVELQNLDLVDRQKVKVGNYTFDIPTFLLNHEEDLYINVGALKTHMEADVSFAIKNQMGILSKEDRIQCHRSGYLQDMVAHIGLTVKADFNFIDGLWGMEGNGPHHGEAKKMDLIMASDDIVELDSLACHIIGLDYQRAGHVVLSQQLGLGQFASPQLMARNSKYINPYNLADKYVKVGKNVYVWPTDGCSRCITALNQSGKIFKSKPWLAWDFFRWMYLVDKKLHLVIGNAKDLKLNPNDKIITIGACTKKFADAYNAPNLTRCPPTVKEAFDLIRKELKRK